MNKKTINIFIVEDDKFYSQLIQTYLTGLGYTNNSVFYSGSKCIEHLSDSPNIIILDYTLGFENGLEILKQIKEFNENIKVIMLSGQEYMHISVKSLKLGAYDYIEKNKESLNNLHITIEKIIAESEERQGNFDFLTNPQ